MDDPITDMQIRIAKAAASGKTEKARNEAWRWLQEQREAEQDKKKGMKHGQLDYGSA